MAKHKYVIRQISALGIISASKWENGDRRFFFDATDISKEYLVEETKQDDCEYVVFPVANFNAYYGATTFSKKKLPQLPQLVSKNRETLENELTNKQLELLEKYTTSVNEMNSISKTAAFKCGFTLAVALLTE